MVAYVLLLGLMWAIMAGMVAELLTSWKEHFTKIWKSIYSLVHKCGTFGEKNAHTFESCELFLLREAFGLFIHLCIMWGIWREKKLLFASPLYC